MMEKKRLQFLLDMDGVLVDFISGALDALNKRYQKNITLRQYASEFGAWPTYDYYGITEKDFWKTIDDTRWFWYNLKPMPWYKELYGYLSSMGDVTIVTAPSLSIACIEEKLAWLSRYLNLNVKDVIFANKKYLLTAPGNILIDDYYHNTESFRSFGGKAILVPSSWNTVDLTEEMVFNVIRKELNVMYVWKD